MKRERFLSLAAYPPYDTEISLYFQSLSNGFEKGFEIGHSDMMDQDHA